MWPTGQEGQKQTIQTKLKPIAMTSYKDCIKLNGFIEVVSVSGKCSQSMTYLTNLDHILHSFILFGLELPTSAVSVVFPTLLRKFTDLCTYLF